MFSFNFYDGLILLKHLWIFEHFESNLVRALSRVSQPIGQTVFILFTIPKFANYDKKLNKKEPLQLQVISCLDIRGLEAKILD